MQVTPNMQLQFGFDPGADAQLERVGDNLVFKFPDGGEIVLTGFYTLPVEELPKLEVGDSEISAQDFLAALGDDTLLPAAPPTAPAAPTAAPGGGFSPYADGSGNLIGGIDYLGKLGRIFWSSPVGNPITELGLEVPGGSGDITIDTNLGDALAAGVFEDARPYQNVGNYDLHPAQLHFNATLTGTTTVANVELSGFDAGTKLYIGLPGQPGTVEIDIASPTQLVNFTHANFTLNGVYIVPPANSDHDMSIHANITLTAVGGLSTVVPAEFTIIVDAVADMPVDVSGNTAVDGIQTGAEHPLESPTSGEATGVTVHMNATFGDVKDGSEHHYFEVKGIPSDWTLNDIPAGWQLQALVGGAWQNVSVAQWNALGHDANTTLRIDVTQAAIAEQKLGGGADQATLSGDIHFNPHDWTSGGTGLDANGNPVDGEGLGRHNDGTLNSDGAAKISIYAVAEEQAGDSELSLDNNTSRVDLGTTTVTIREDTPDFASDPIRIISDETRHVQGDTDEMRIRDIPVDVNAKLAEIADLPGSRPLSAAGSPISYDLHSDGKADSGGDLGKTFLGFEGSDGADSGWATTGGKEIFMYYQDGMAIGRVGVLDPVTNTYVADPAGKIAFVAVATGTLQGGAAENGEVTFVQYESLRHPDHGTSSNPDGYNEEMGSDLGLKLVLIDDDGDKTSLDVNINVHDDQPVIENITAPQKVDETFLDMPNGVLVTGGHVDYSFGRDVDGAKVEWDAAQLPKLTCGGQEVQYDTSDPHQVRGFIVDAGGKEHDVLSLTFSDKNGDGHGHYVYKQFIAVDHPDPTDHDEPLDFAFTLKVTDGDGDVVSQAISFRVEDDGPCAGLFVPANVVFEDTLRGDAHMMQANGNLSYDFGADHNVGADIFWDKSVLADTFKDVNATFGKSTSPVEVRYPDHGTDNANPNQPHYAEVWTKDPATGADVKVADMLIFQDAEGHYKYEYNQYHAIEHGASGTPQDIVKEFNLGYTIMDSDGDTASNVVAMHVTDSVTVPRVDNLAHFDESDMKSDFSGIEGTIALKLDYDAPDGIKDVTWDLKGVNANLDIYNKMAPSEADGFYAKLDATGHVLEIYQHGVNGVGGVLVANVTLVEMPDGTYSAVYDQVHQIDHPLGHQVGGLSHDEPLPFVLPMHVTDGDNDVTPSALTIVVDDDGPSPVFASNVLLLEGIGKAVLDNMHDLDFSDASKFLNSLQTAIGEAITTGLGDPKALVDLTDLVMNSNLMMNSGDTPIIGKDSDRTENAGITYSGKLAVDFGNDGPADPADHNSYNMNPVGFSAAGFEGLLNVLGVHQTGHGNAHLEVVGSGGNPPTTLEVYSSDDPTHQHSVMTLNIIGSGSGPYSYEITQHLPLGHNANSIEDMLKDALSNGTALPPELAALGDPSAILTALGGGNMLALPLPIVVTDNDGDSALGLAVVAIRDSVPVAPAAASAYVGESDLLAATNHGDAGRDAAHAQENVAQNTNADESVYKGSMTVNYGFDGAHKDSPFEWNKPADGLYKTSDGKPIHWDYDGGDHMKLVGYDEGGNKVAVIEVTKFTNNYDVSDPAHPDYTGTVEYKVTLLESLQHPTAQGENDLKLDIGFIIRDGDGDTAGNTLSVVVKDDIPQGYDEWDKTDTVVGTDGYGATGNVLTGLSNWSDSAFTKQPGTPDTYGADGRAVTGGFKVVQPDFSTPDIHDGTAKAVEPGAPVTIAGKYGDITFNSDGSYTYTIDKVRYEAGVPTKTVTQFPETTIDLANDPLNNSDVSFTAFKNKGFYRDGWTPKNDPLPSGTDFLTLTNIKNYIGSHSATAVDAGSGVGVSGNVNSTIPPVNDGDEIGRGGSASEGLLIDLKNAGDQYAQGEVSIKFGDLSNAEAVNVYLYDASGNLIPGNVPGGAFLFYGFSGDTFSYNGATPVAHIVVMPTVPSNTFTVDAITYPKATTVEVPDPSAPYNPQETFDYILTDKDGDSTQQTLTIKVDPPILVGLSGSALVYESEHTPAAGVMSSDDAPGVAHYTLQAYSYYGTEVKGAALYEDVIVTIKVNLAGASDSDINYKGATVTLADGTTVPAVFNIATHEFTVKIPAGDADGKVVLNLPMLEDYVGGKGTSNDSPVEPFSLEVTKIVGASGDTSHYVDPTNTRYDYLDISHGQNTDLIDDGTTDPVLNANTGHYEASYLDNRLDYSDADKLAGKVSYSHSDDKHPLDGPMISVTAPTTVNEGDTTAAAIRLSGLNPDTKLAYATGNDGLYTKEPIVLTMKFDLTGGATAADIASIKAAAATGVTYEYQNNGGTWVTLPATGIPTGELSDGTVNVRITVPTGFNLSGIGNLGLNVLTTNDNLGESGEGFKVAITGVSGNESTYYGAEHGTAVNDPFLNKLLISGGQEVLEGETINYTLTLQTTTKISAGNTDTVTAILHFSDAAPVGDAHKAGQSTFDADYTLAKIAAQNPNLTFTDLSGQADGQGGTYPAGTVQVTIPAGAWTIDTTASGGYYDNTYTLKVPTEVDTNVAEAKEHVIVTITEAKGAEIGSWSGVGDGIIRDEATMSISGTKVIYEDPTDGTTIATYNIAMNDKGVPVNPSGALDSKVAGQTFTFDLTLRDNGATFDPNMKDNINSDGSIQNWNGKTGMADYGWAVDGKIVDYGDLSDNALTNAGRTALITAINNFLKADPQYNGITVTGVSNNGRTLTFEVKEGASIVALEKMPIQVGALDDAISDNGEKYKIILSNIVEKGTSDAFDSIEIKGREAETTINDDSGKNTQDGYLVGVRDMPQSESSNLTGDSFKGDGFKVPVLLFDRGADPGVLQTNPPVQNITVTLQVTSGTAIDGQDFYTSGGTVTATVTPGQWVFVAASGTVPAHWEAMINIPRNDDRLTEGNENFSVSVKSVSGHESTALGATDIGGISGTATMTIVDDTILGPNQYDANGNLIAGGPLDGPVLAHFGPDGKVVEPTAPNVSGGDARNPSDPGNAAVVNTVSYKIVLDSTAAEDIVVFIKSKDLGSDYRIPDGGGLNALTKADLAALQATYGKYGTLDAKGADFYIIVPKGSAEVSFKVDILHDHDTASNTRGVDKGTDYVDLKITNMQGSEVRFGDANQADPHSKVEIADDMHGPVASVSFPASATTDSDVAVTAKIPVSANEDVYVTVRITDASGAGTDYQIKIPAGATSGTSTIHMPASDYVYYQVIGSDGGETQHDDKMGYMDLSGGSGGGQSRITLGVEASDITEDPGTLPAHAGTTVEYAINGHIPADHTDNADLTFTLKVVNNGTSDADFLNGGPGHDVTVTIPKELLDLVGAGNDFKVVINENGVSFTDAAGNPIVDPSGREVTVSGDLAQAYDDRLVEGDEGFSTIITNISGGGGATVDAGNAVAEAKIIDNDVPHLDVSYWVKNSDGTFTQIASATEGDGNVYVKVTLLGSDNQPVQLANGHVVVDLGHDASSTATRGQDFVLVNDHLVIESGESSAMTQLLLPNDYKSEGTEKLIITAAVDAIKSDGNYGDMSGWVSGKGPDLSINDLIDGPNLRFSAAATSMNEGSSMTYSVALDKALEEDATLTMKVDLANGDTKDGFTLSDVKSITVDGVKYVYDSADSRFEDGSGNDASSKVYIDANGDIIFKVVMANGTSYDSFSIETVNNKITENNDHLKVSITDAQGGEICVDGVPFANVPAGNQYISSDVLVKDVLDGPTITLAPKGEGTEGETVSVQLILSGKSTSIVSDTDISLKLGTDVLTNLVAGDKVSVYDGNNSLVGKFDIAPNGSISLHLTEGVQGPLTLTFPLQDNAIEGANDKFSISLDGVVGGEASIGGMSNYSSGIVSESDNSLTFELSGSASSQDAKATITLDGIPGDKAAFVQDIVLYDAGGTKIATIPGSELTVSGGKLVYTLPNVIPSGTSLDDYKVVVDFNKAAMTPADIAAAKLDGSVVVQMAGAGITVTVHDDAGTPAQDGPVFTVTAPAEADEGSLVTFTVNTAAKTGFETSEQDISLKFKLTGDFTGRVTGLDLSDAAKAAGLTLSGPVNGEYTVKLPLGTDLDNWDGAIKAQLNGVDTKIGVDGGLGLQLTGVSGGEASLGATVAGSTVIHDVTEGQLMLVNNSGASVNEGSSMDFTLKLVGTDGTTALTATQAMSVTLHLSGVGTNPAVAADLNLNGWTDKGAGVYEKTLTLNANSSSVNLSIGTMLDGILEHTEGVHLEVVSSSVPANIAANITNNAATAEFDIDITDTSSGHLVLTPPSSLDVLEGGSLGFKLDLQNATTHAAMTAVEAMTVTFLVSGLAAAGVDAATLGGANSAIGMTDGSGVTWTQHLDSITGQPDGSYVMTATLAAGQNHLDINIPVNTAADSHLIHGLEGLEIKLLGTETNGLNVALTDTAHTAVAAGTHYDVSISDVDYATLQSHLGAHTPALDDVKGMELVDMGVTANHDGSAATHGQIIFGGDGDNSIIGSGHNDIIFGGGGHDTLTGGLGDDIFGWHSTDIGSALAPAVDHITDFSMTTDPLHQGSFGDDHLDLRDLISDAKADTLDNYLTIEHNGANAELHISTTAGGPVTQTIVLENVYTSHGVDLTSPTVDQDTSHVDELIKQHIILNS